MGAKAVASVPFAHTPNPRYHQPMESPALPVARRSEDIALDLLKFVAAHSNITKSAGGSTPGFGTASTAKPEDQVDQLLALYARCRQAVESSAK